MTTTLNHSNQHAISAARARAEETLRVLKQSQTDSEQRLAEAGQPDHLKRVTGKSAFDNAIVATQRVIDTLDRQAAKAAHQHENDALPVVTIDPRAAVSQPSRFARVS
jgi:flavin-binding protein dodecin